MSVLLIEQMMQQLQLVSYAAIDVPVVRMYSCVLMCIYNVQC